MRELLNGWMLWCMRSRHDVWLVGWSYTVSMYFPHLVAAAQRRAEQRIRFFTAVDSSER